MVINVPQLIWSFEMRSANRGSRAMNRDVRHEIQRVAGKLGRIAERIRGSSSTS